MGKGLEHTFCEMRIEEEIEIKIIVLSSWNHEYYSSDTGNFRQTYKIVCNIAVELFFYK